MASGSGDGERMPAAAPAAGGWAAVTVGLVEASGPDAVRFIDNFTTAAVSGLAVGGGTEGFFTDARGWVLALATILRTEDGVIVVTDASLAAGLTVHLEHHHIRERLELRDLTKSTEAVLVSGPGAADAVVRLGELPLPEVPAGHARAVIGGCDARIVRVTRQGADGYRIDVPAGQAAAVAARLEAAGVMRADPALLDALRIEAGYPAPADIPPRTLPQELGRDATAISFTKGCYLGQETVARLDALGHVNRRLAVLAIDAAGPPALPARVLREGVEVGILTSARTAPWLGGTIGLGLVQVRALAAGGLTVAAAAARPLPPGTGEVRA